MYVLGGIGVSWFEKVLLRMAELPGEKHLLSGNHDPSATLGLHGACKTADLLEALLRGMLYRLGIDVPVCFVKTTEWSACSLIRRLALSGANGRHISESHSAPRASRETTARDGRSRTSACSELRGDLT